LSDAARRPPPISAARWLQIEPLLDAALEVAASERAAYIARACADDALLRDEVLQLLAEFDLTAPELEHGVAAAFPALVDAGAAETMHVPERLAGRYRIERVLGEGGMAVVYLALDERLERQVAIKVLRPDTARRAGGDRFTAEIRLTAQLRHPNIVPLFDSGETEDWTFFVMPYLEGETLGARVERVGPLDVGTAVRIVLDVAAALDYAHRAGVVHRDVKPSNILLADGHTLLSDFGIARLTGALRPGFTETGAVVGTPAYMSPEQCSGASVIGPASDIYSLGAVLLVLLTGERPIPAVARLAMEEAGIGVLGPRHTAAGRLAPAMLVVIARAMAITPGERYATAGQFALALQQAAEGFSPVSSGTALAATPTRRIPWVAATSVAAATVALAALILSPTHPAPQHSAGAGAGDSTRYVLLPYEYDASVPQRFGRPDPLRGALARWSDITVVDEAQTDEALGAARSTSGRVTSSAATALARATGAGRFVRREVAVRGVQAYVHAAVYDAATGSMVSEGAVNLGADIERPDSAMAELAEQLLLAAVPTGIRTGAYVGTRSRAGLQSFASGMSAVDRWDLAFADSALEQATVHDSAFARARLWLAQVRVWRNRPRETWNFLVNRAVDRRDLLAPRDQRALDALVAAGRGDGREACTLWKGLAEAEATDFAAWYGAASCERQDDAVLRDARSPSGWRFRSSDHRAIATLRRAFEIFPVVHREFRTSWFAALDGLLMTSPTQLRLGFAQPPDSGLFMAYPSWSETGDTLAFLPYRAADFEQARPWTLPSTHREAVRRQRELFLQTATTWRAAFPRSADALLAVAVALDKLGDPSAIDSLRAARALAGDEGERLRTGAATVWMLVKYGIPDDLRALRAAHALADSLLTSRPAAPADRAGAADRTGALASVAMLTGHVSLAAHLAREGGESADDAIPEPVKRLAAALQVFAAAGGPADSLASLERMVEEGIARSVAPAARDGARRRLLGRAATLAFPAYRSALLATFVESGDQLSAAQHSWASGDTAAVRRHLASLHIGRGASLPDEVKLETLLPESLLLVALGDVPGAVDRIAGALQAVRYAELEAFRSPVGAGVLARAVAQRAELAAALGDRRGAQRWGDAFLSLWGHGDQLSRPLVARISRVAGSAGNVGR